MHLLFKKQFETCLDCINRYKALNPDIGNLTYAGRLDPLASGLLIALPPQDIELKKSVLEMPKTYTFDIVFGVGTDTFDQLGIIFPSEDILTWKTLNFDKEKINKIQNNLSQEFKNGIDAKISQINENLQILIGDTDLYYPFFSSKPIDGIPLFQYTKTYGVEKTNSILPSHSVRIDGIVCNKIDKIEGSDLVKESISIAQTVKGDFRQTEIIESWEKQADFSAKQFLIWSCTMTVSSGFYIRSFGVWLGQLLGTPALVRNIVRTSVGKHTLTDVEF